MTAAVWTTFVVVAFVGLGLLSYLVETMGDRIAEAGPRPVEEARTCAPRTP